MLSWETWEAEKLFSSLCEKLPVPVKTMAMKKAHQSGKGRRQGEVEELPLYLYPGGTNNSPGDILCMPI